jgi:hypothetical protein
MSNHSYVRNSNFAGNYAMEIGGQLNSRLLHSNNSASIRLEDSLFLDIDLYHTNSGAMKYGVRISPSLNDYFGNDLAYYLFISGHWGKIEIGAAADATENLKIGAAPLSVSSMVVGSSLARHLKFFPGSGNIIFEPSTSMNQNLDFTRGESLKKSWNHTKYLNKISYYSPELFGFQLGLSLIPNIILADKDLDLVDGGEKFNFGYATSVALNYIETIMDVSVAASVVFEGNFKNPFWKIPLSGGKITEEHSLAAKFTSYGFGLSVSYFGITVASSLGYGNKTLDDNLATKTNSEKKLNGRYITGGIGYEISSFTIGIVYFNSRYGDNILETMDYGVKKTIAKNLSTYAEFIDYRYRIQKSGTRESWRELAAVIGLIINF